MHPFVTEVPRGDAHRTLDVLELQPLPGGLGDHGRQLVDRHELLRTDIRRTLQVGLGQHEDAVDQIVDIDEGAAGAAVTPYLDRPRLRGLGDLAAQGSRSLLPSAPKGPLRAVAILEPPDADGETVATPVGQRQPLRVELLPSVFVVGQGGVGTRFIEGVLADVHVPIDADR